MTTLEPAAVVAGHLCLDLVCRVAYARIALDPGQLMEISGTTVATGGAVSNTGLALSKLGVATTLVAKVGADGLGTVIKQHLLKNGAGVEGVTASPGCNTSYTIVLTPPSGERMFLHDAGANAEFGADDARLELLSGARLFHFGYPPLMPRLYREGGRGLAQLFEGVKALGLITSLDMSMPDPTSESGGVDWRAVLERALPYVDCFLPSFEEILSMLRPETFEQLARSGGAVLHPDHAGLVSGLAAELLTMGPSVVGIKLGPLGFYVRTSAAASQLAASGAWHGRELWAPCYQVQVAGTVGAGDTTVAGFLAGLLHGLSLEEAMDTACAVGACCVEAPDAVSGVRTWQATQARMQEGWRRCELTLPEGWCAAGPSGLWRGPNDRPEG
jgi:sugar/nucleoside kinase (ribokinase family)